MSRSTQSGFHRILRAIPAVAGVAALAGVGLLFLREIFPKFFPIRSHEFLAAFPLAAIAVAYLCYQGVRRVAPREFLKAILLSLAFLFWSANQFWPDCRQATLFNDMAIALFVLDIFLIMIGWPASSADRT
jgi:hypothetical protein